MITRIPKELELKYHPDWGWYVNVPEAYPADLLNGWIKNIAYPTMVKRVKQLPKGDLREHMTKVLKDLYDCKVHQRVYKKAFDIFKSTEKQTTKLYHYN